MIEAAEAIQRFIEGRCRNDLDTDQMPLFASVRATEIIGEAASKLSRETKSTFGTVPWPAIVATRNRLIHAYFDIDHDNLWKTVSEEIPALLLKLQGLASGGHEPGPRRS